MKKRSILMVVVVLLSVLAAPLACHANEAQLVEEKALLMQAILKLSLELNATDAKLQEAIKLYDGAEEDVTLLSNEVKTLRSKLDEAVKLYQDAEADVTMLRSMTERLTKEIEARDATLVAYRNSANAKATLAFLAGAIGGAAAAILWQLLNK